MGDNLECIALIYKELLTLGAVVHFLGIFRYKGVKEGIKTFVVASFGTQDPTCRDGQSGTETNAKMTAIYRVAGLLVVVIQSAKRSE